MQTKGKDLKQELRHSKRIFYSYCLQWALTFIAHFSRNNVKIFAIKVSETSCINVET